MERARSKLRRSAVVAEKLTDEEQATFRYALSCFGKNFSKIQQLVRMLFSTQCQLIFKIVLYL